LTFVYHFTRFCEAIPITKQDTETIVREFVVRIITQFGVPRRLLTDRGANFTSALIKETCKLLKIRKLQTNSYNPQANGICERMHKLVIDMISHFVRKDARNWDEYVPYAVMAYRDMPHCSTKYSPYYLVLDREMRLPIEDDWRPSVGKNAFPEVDYERHIRTLAERLREANKVAGCQSKLNRDVAKLYYDRQTKLEKFGKGDLVYVHGPTYKKVKTKKFSYKHKWPFEMVERISPFIYKVRLRDGTSAIVHINRLKRSYGQNRNREQEDRFKNVPQEKCTRPEGTPELNAEITSGIRLLDNEDESLSETEEAIIDKPSQRYTHDADWAPRSLYLQLKLQSDKATNGIAYRLRSKGMSRSEPEPENDNVQSSASSDDSRPTPSHSYNLRARSEVTQPK